MKNEKGVTLAEVLIVLALILIIAVIAIPSMQGANDSDFFAQEFGFKPSAVNDTTRPALQPLVTQRLETLRGTYRQIASYCAEQAKVESGHNLRDLESCSSALEQRGHEIARATTLAEGVGFDIKLRQ